MTVSINKLISLINIQKSYNALEENNVIENFSLDVYKGDFIGIIGNSGCGKSTILNIIAGLIKDYKGNITINDILSIGYMFQSDTLFEWLSIYENAILGLKLKKMITKEKIQYVNNLLKKYDLYDYKDKYPKELSGGMRQRVALIRTLATKPDLILLDEPFSALDYITKLKVSNDVFNIIKEEKITAIIVTHDISEAIALCNKVIVLSKKPSHIKKCVNIEMNCNIPNKKRKNPMFLHYYDLLWKELDNDEKN